MLHRHYAILGVASLGLAMGTWLFARDMATGAPTKRLDIHPQPISSDPAVKYNYDIVYVRAPRKGDDQQILWADVFQPLQAEPGSDLILLHPDGREEVLVAAGDDAIADPFVSFDGQSVYYARFHNVRPPGSDTPVAHSADIFRIHVKSRKIVQLTRQEFTPDTGVALPNLAWPGVYNLGPCPLPGGRVIFTSNRNGFISTKDYKFWAERPGYTTSAAMQLFVMDSDGQNVEMIGHLNINGALHPTILKDGRVMFSSFESEALHDVRQWAIWTINPDGTMWQPMFSALGASGETARHFMTQLSDGSVVAEEYYFQQTMGFGTFFRMAANVPDGQPYFGPASKSDTRNLDVPQFGRVPFTPHGLEELTRFSHITNSPAFLSDPADPKSPRVGKVSHPSGAPDNHLLLAYSPGPVHGINPKSSHPFAKPAIDSGIYLLKDGKPVDEPGQLLLIKNDPNYNEQWPRALVPYKRIHGVDEPVRLTPLSNDGTISKHLPEGTPYGLIGTSSLYKRESYPFGGISPGQVTARFAGGKSPMPSYSGSTSPVLLDIMRYGGESDPFQGLGRLAFADFFGNWFVQGADAGKYGNNDVHAVRILVTVPTTDPRYQGRTSRRWWNAADERLRILGEFPVRKFNGGQQPLDPDGNPDTSFLVKIPADVAWTFQTLDKHGMVLNMAQTWHQLRPGEMRTNCGGCHGHSQEPTEFEKTAAAKPDYPIFDLTRQTPLLTTRPNDQSGRKWDSSDETGLRFVKGALNVEYFRDIQPIFDRSCVGCHTIKSEKPAGDLVLDDKQPVQADFWAVGLSFSDNVPGTFMRLAIDPHGKFGHKSGLGTGKETNPWPLPQGSRYIRYFQSRRSLLVWKIFGQRMDGFRNEDFAYETISGDPNSMMYQGKPFHPVDGNRGLINLAYTGSVMPPPSAVAGTYAGADGRRIKVAPLTDEDRLAIVRWIDLGCPIDLDYDPSKPDDRGHGWLEDDNRPTLAMTYPRPGANTEMSRILIGMHDFDSGLDLDSLQVVADFAIDGVAAGRNLAPRFKLKSEGVFELRLAKPLTRLSQAKLTLSVKDKAGNATRIERTFSVGRSKRAFVVK